MILLLLLALEHGLEAGAQRERRLAGARAAAERDDADLGVEQQVDREALLRGAAVQAEDVAVAAHEPVARRRRSTRPRAEPRSEWMIEAGVDGQPSTSSPVATSLS